MVRVATRARVRSCLYHSLQVGSSQGCIKAYHRWHKVKSQSRPSWEKTLRIRSKKRECARQQVTLDKLQHPTTLKEVGQILSCERPWCVQAVTSTWGSLQALKRSQRLVVWPHPCRRWKLRQWGSYAATAGANSMVRCTSYTSSIVDRRRLLMLRARRYKAALITHKFVSLTYPRTVKIEIFGLYLSLRK